MNGYDLSRNFCNWAFENPDKVKPIHYAIFYFSIEHCNRLGWKDKFGLPSQMVMEAIGIKNWRTYSAGLHELVEFGFIEMIEISKNQYSSNIIAIVKNTKAPTKALDKALQKHSTKHSQSTVSIVKQETTNNKPTLDEFVAYGIQQLPEVDTEALRLKYSSWVESNWIVTVGGKTRPIKNWKSTLNNTLPYLPKMITQPIDPLVVEMKRQRQMYGLE
jgi:hypothetical protein